jgi:hypothetical protein
MTMAHEQLSHPAPTPTRPWPPAFDPEDGYGLDPAEVADEQRFAAAWLAERSA